jgi:uncharacterized protein DUF4340
MGKRGTILLAVLILLVGAYVWYEEAPPADTRPVPLGEPPREPTTPVRHLVEFDPASVFAVSLEHTGQVRRADRSSGEWSSAAEAMTDFVHNLLGIGVLVDMPSAPTDLADFGLQRPQSIVRIALRGQSTPVVLLIGDRNPATTGVYVRIGDNGPVVLAGALVTWEFDKAFKALDTSNAGG